MACINSVILTGRLTRDPDFRTFNGGGCVVKIGLAVSERYRTKDGQLTDRTTFVEIEAWGRTAEICNEYLTKGREIAVQGKLQLDRWQTQEGENRSRLKVRADRVQFLGGRGDLPEEMTPQQAPTIQTA